MTTDDVADDITYEYAIEVPGQGWLLIIIPGTYSVVPEPVIIGCQPQEAWKDLDRARNFYSRIGAGSVGAQLRLVVRTVTVVRSGWEDA